MANAPGNVAAKGGIMAQPLSKTKEDDGTLYTRPPPIEAAIDIAIHQDLQTLCQRARIRDRNDPHHLSSECLVHLTRQAIRTDDGTAYNALLPLLLERCRANLNKYVVASVPNAEHLRETILCDFAALFAMDGTVDDKFWALDFFECRFNLAFASFRQTRVTCSFSGILRPDLPLLAESSRQISHPTWPVESFTISHVNLAISFALRPALADSRKISRSLFAYLVVDR